jgi:hypothetical protein
LAVLERARERDDIPADHGLRLAGHDATRGETVVSLTWAVEPDASDQVIETKETVPLFVAADIAPSLVDAVIDVDEANDQLVIRTSRGRSAS